MFKIGAFGIIFDEQQRVLLCHRCDFDVWNLPGGGVEANESPWEAVVREVQEETGLKVKVERLTGVYFKPDKNEIVFSFACKIYGGAIRTNNEADKISYFSLHSIPSNTLLKHLERIIDAFNFPETTVMSNQRGMSSLDALKLAKK